MTATMARVALFMFLLLGLFLWVGSTITAMTGGDKRPKGGAVEVTPEGGEAIFWGKGRCFTCHSLGGQGSAVRCPNLGQFGDKFALPIGARAAERAKERSAKTGQTYSATDYLVESLAEPGAYVVEGYKDEMAVVYAPPISLNLTEIKAVIAYLQSQGGDVDMEALNKPSEISQKFFARIAAASAAGGGDPGAGEGVFEDNCSECHSLGGEDEELPGPDLKGIGKKGLKFLSESILKPAKEITKGFETYQAVMKDGRKHVGLKSRDEGGEVDITKANGDVETLAKAEIKELKEDKGKSIMPEDLIEALTVKDYQDVLSFLLLQKGE